MYDASITMYALVHQLHHQSLQMRNTVLGVPVLGPFCRRRKILAFLVPRSFDALVAWVLTIAFELPCPAKCTGELLSRALLRGVMRGILALLHDDG
jgi:hypothetical protein